MSTTQTGVVKWFNDGKGFGFITPEDGSKDLFAHFSEIRNNGGFRSLAENQRVEFEVKQGPKGLQAANISRRTGYTKEDLEQIAMLGFMQAARRYSPDHGDFRPFAGSNANGDGYHYLRDKGFLIKVSASWRELHGR